MRPLFQPLLLLLAGATEKQLARQIQFPTVKRDEQFVLVYASG